MSSRAASELLLVGSLPADSTEAAFRAGAELFGDLVFALPDGETGPRAAWVGYERERLVRPNPDVEVVEETASPTGIPRHAYETPVFKVRDGRRRAALGHAGRASTTRSSPTAMFRALRDEGVIPAGLRFQIGLPFPSSALNAFKADFAARLPGRRARVRGPRRAASSCGCIDGIPPTTSRSSGTSAYEVQDIEGVLAWTPRRRVGALRRPGDAAHATDPRGRRSSATTSATARSPSGRCTRRATWSVLVRMANHAVAQLGAPGRLGAHGRPALPAQRGRALLPRRCATSTSGDTRVFLGIVLPIDGIPGLRRRHATASRTSTTSAWRCTAASAASPGATAGDDARAPRCGRGASRFDLLDGRPRAGRAAEPPSPVQGPKSSRPGATIGT